MNTCLSNSWKMIFPAVLLCICLAGSAAAADFFPLDIWEEISAWQSKKGNSDPIGPKADLAPRSSVRDLPGKTPDALPWDVREELHALGSDRGYHASRFFVTIDASPRNRANPYWLPEELRWEPLPGAFPIRLADYLTDLR